MVEKQRLLDAEPAQRPAPRRMSGWRMAWLAVLSLVALACTSTWARFLLPQTSLGIEEPSFITYEGEYIRWQRCGTLEGHTLECSNIDVPMDQFNASNSGSKVFSIPIIRLRGRNATQNLFLNPGGPGGSGVEFVYRRGKQLLDVVGEGFHLLSFDPRGINGSRPQATCYPDDETRRSLAPVRNKKFSEDSGDLHAWTQNFVRSCVDTMGEHGKYINTPQTAADMNTILDRLGQKDMIYWGFSYGTLLGQTYATLFPERSKRVIIDGVANQFDWYGSLLDAEELADTDNVFYGFLDECIKAGKNCSLSSLASTKEKLLEVIMGFSAKLEKQPISVYVNNTVYGLFDYSALWSEGIFPTLYKPANWYVLADRLAKLIQGNATEAFLAYGRDEFVKSAGDAFKVVTLSDGASGPKRWAQDLPSLLDKLTPYFNRSLFSSFEFDFYFSKQQWLVPHTHDYVPRKGVKTAHPLLLLSTTYDPVCPLVSARSANAAFEGSRIVEVKGYGHCSLAVTSMCVAKKVREYLYEGKLPKKNVQCEVDKDWQYFVVPKEEGKATVATALFEDPEEERIHRAQVELSQDLWFNVW